MQGTLNNMSYRPCNWNLHDDAIIPDKAPLLIKEG